MRFRPSQTPPASPPKRRKCRACSVRSTELDASLERAVEAYNLATDKLHAIEGDLQANLHELHIAKANLKRSQAALSKRLVTIYTSGNEANSTLGILLGAGSIDDMLSQIETSNRVSNQDLRINRADHRVPRRRSGSSGIELKNAEAEAQALVQERPTRGRRSSHSWPSAGSWSPRSAARSSR